MNILEKIVITKRKEITTKKKKKSFEKIREECLLYTSFGTYKDEHRSLREALLSGHSLGLIAEIKLASPILGQLTQMSNRDIAKIYAQSQADVISVLTDEVYFHGHLSFLQEVRKICQQPILRKDFIIDPYQIYETALAGGDAFLIIASILTEKEIRAFIQLGKELGLESLVEVHDEEELKKVLRVGAKIIGINNRNLKTMKIDVGTTEKLAKQIPKGKIIVSESGINTQADRRRIIKAGARGMLVGTAIIQSNNMLEKINELKAVKV